MKSGKIRSRNFPILFFLILCGSCSKEVSDKSQIKTDVVYLADDLLEGRQTGTEGEKKAAAYIAQRYKQLGLIAKGTKNFEQEFSFIPKTCKSF